MSENSQSVTSNVNSNLSMIKIIYVLFCIGYFTGGLTSFVGVILAYMNRGNATEFEKSHFNYLIKLFWISFVAVVLSAITWVILIGIAIAFIWFVWSLIKIIKGVSRLGEGKLPTQK
ncbi:hypothetical protein ELZ88_24830 (plasmid) [Salmonella enterica subsp. enterica serovar Karamoja]|uniref:DUF4870 domain-containing protein n=2 Tax=Salmonella enterica TaxID=28901 RepID=A0A3Q9MM92_SALET|nr:hypothetical protein [Salmonella enterica]AZT39745.1 hypothetical protein ELZ88_24830 [Salmonella enterica subsp. enterica serovar Karamoja]AZT44352.1 hypothetical protein EL007_24135 [Salmonella enterica subsp. enterica serovar Karamoja]